VHRQCILDAHWHAWRWVSFLVTVLFLIVFRTESLNVAVSALTALSTLPSSFYARPLLSASRTRKP
jgi:hypothetical protein